MERFWLVMFAAPMLLWVGATIVCEAFFSAKLRFIDRLAIKMKELNNGQS